MTSRSDSLSFFGETEIRLYGIDYPMKFDINVLNQWEQATSKDFAHLTMRCILAWQDLLKRRVASMAQQGAEGSDTLKFSIAEEAEQLTSIVSRSDAAHLFYLGAKAANGQVSFDEIQEGVMLDGPYRRKVTDENHPDYEKYTESYPILFVNVVLALQSAYDNLKKKPVTQAPSSPS